MKQALFARPHLPRGLIGFAILLILSQAGILLMNLPAAYWLDPKTATAGETFQVLLSLGPWLFTGLVFLYVALVGLLLYFLRQTFALALFGCLTYFHFHNLVWSTNWAYSCKFYIFHWYSTYSSCSTATTILWLFWAILLCLALLDAYIVKKSLFTHPRNWVFPVCIGLSTAWLLILGIGVVASGIQPASGWRPVISAHTPGPRMSAAVAYDTKRGRLVLFGGTSLTPSGGEKYDTDTWEWDGKDWTQVQTSGGPPGRTSHAMAYDPKRGVVVLYGGTNGETALSDVWEWNGKTWTQACPVCNPAARYLHQMYYDPVLQQVVIYGGANGETGYHEAWSWNGKKWAYVNFASQAPYSWTGSLVYDSNHERVIGFLGEPWGGTWFLDNGQWSKAVLPVEPPKRMHFGLVYDPDHGRTILFGGKPDNTTWFNDTWVFDGNTWKEIKTLHLPPPRSDFAAFYDPTRHAMMIYGGQGLDDYYNDMWELVLP